MGLAAIDPHSLKVQTKVWAIRAKIVYEKSTYKTTTFGILSKATLFT